MKLSAASKLFKAPPARPDWLIFGVAALVCFLVFEHTDILSTGAASLAYLEGHVLDFPDYVAAVLAPIGYLPSTYVVFALWNIPLRLLGRTMVSSLSSPGFRRR